MSTPTGGWTIGGAATATTSPLTVSNTQASRTSDYIPIYSQSLAATVAVNINTLLGISSQVVSTGDPQTLTNKTLTSPAVSSPVLSGTATGTYTLGGTPTINNATMSSPAITGGSLAIDAITGQSVSNSGTIYGMSVSSGILASAAIANKVNTAALQAASVTPDKLATGAVVGTVATNETTTSTTYTDLATVGPSATVTIGANGMALVCLKMAMYNSGSNTEYATVVASGANTIAAADAYLQMNGVNPSEYGSSILLTGLTPGSTTFTVKYRTATGTATFVRRILSVIPL